MMITDILKKLSSHLNIPIIPEKKDIMQSIYPHGVYSVKEMDFNPPHQRIRKQEKTAKNMVKIYYYYSSSMTFLLRFYNKSNTDDDLALERVITLVQESWLWLNGEGREICRKNNVVLCLKPKEVDKKQEEEKKENLYIAGFEFVLKSTFEQTSTEKTITGIDYTVEAH